MNETKKNGRDENENLEVVGKGKGTEVIERRGDKNVCVG